MDLHTFLLHSSERGLLLHIIENQHKIMSTLTDIQAQNAALIAAVTDENTVIDSAEKLIAGFASQLTDIQAQLKAALESNDPALLQSVSDSMGSTIATITAKNAELAAAVAAGTPAPAAPPADTVPAA